jgi:hypothetical protein
MTFDEFLETVSPTLLASIDEEIAQLPPLTPEAAKRLGFLLYGDRP